MDERSTGLVIVGAGAAGLLAAVAGRRLGLEVLVIEAASRVGGATAVGDGALWLPGNDLMGTGSLPKDSVEEAAEYLVGVLGQAPDPTIEARRAAFVRTAGKLGRWLRSSQIKLSALKDVPDEAAEVPGGKRKGRCVSVDAIAKGLVADLGTPLGEEPPAASFPVIGGLQRLAGRIFGGGEVAAGGPALIAELLRRAVSTGVDLWLNSPMTELIVEEGRAAGVLVARDGETTRIMATEGVLLACGGFEADADLRGEHLPLPTDPAWSITGVPTNTGAALAASQVVGAAVAGLADAWWTPVMVAQGRAYDLDHARSTPHGMIVDQAGDRFFDESSSPVAAARAIFDRNRGMRAVPSYLILDNAHRQAYPLGPWAAGETPRQAIEDGDLFKAATLNELAQALGVDRAGLIGTSVQFNQGASKGRDADFGRGQTVAAKARGDLKHRRNPCLGKVEKGPYWAVKVYPGDAGTKGGLVVDDEGRVLDEQGSIVPGLHACGGAAVSCFGRGYPARGAALGAALVEAYRAVLSISGQLARLDEAIG